VHNKCIYALDKANQLKGRRGLIEVFDDIFTEHFDKLQPANIVNIAKIFAKNGYAQRVEAAGKLRYFGKLE